MTHQHAKHRGRRQVQKTETHFKKPSGEKFDITQEKKKETT